MPGRLVIISAPSGTGKTTVTRKFLAAAPDWVRVVTVTTRDPRPEETDGVDYRFVSRQEFAALVAKGHLVEHAFVFGNGYGTPRDGILAAWADGKGAVLVLDVQGKKQANALFPDAVTVFLMPPSAEEQERRIRKRGADSEESVRRRLDEAKKEMSEAGGYDHILTNDDADETARRLSEILRGP